MTTNDGTGPVALSPTPTHPELTYGQRVNALVLGKPWAPALGGLLFLAGGRALAGDFGTAGITFGLWLLTVVLVPLRWGLSSEQFGPKRIPLSLGALSGILVGLTAGFGGVLAGLAVYAASTLSLCGGLYIGRHEERTEQTDGDDEPALLNSEASNTKRGGGLPAGK